MKAIFARTSIRAYQERPVEEEKLRKLMEAAMAAPSAGNQQPWEFYIVTDKEKLAALSEASPYAGCAKDAPVAIVVCSRKDGLRFPDYAHIDCSIASEHIWLEATELGLGCVWLGIAPMPERMEIVRQVLGLPPTLDAFALMPVGYPLKEQEQQDRFDASRIHKIEGAR